ncbi:MAG: TetR family transcriptional regulator C-terminal domain-containing protein [Sphingomonas sp.]|nr:TetR family transcriptional regulator C-terminal domain-containing protein [Sphingomonas sp.]
MPRPANLETRSRLLEKGGELISNLGFNATGVQEITAAAGVPKGSFYNYFESKEAFALAILNEYCESMMAAYGPILDQRDTPPLLRIARYFEGIAEFHARRDYAAGCLIGNMALEVTPTSDLVRARLSAIYRDLTTALADCLREAQVKGDLAPAKDPARLADALIDTFEGAVMRAKVERSRAPFDSFERYVLPSLLT